MNDTFPASPSGATCGPHPDRPAVQACPRCGTFMCQECRALGRDLQCPACAARQSDFPMSRDAYTISGIWDLAVEHFKREWLMLSLGFLLMLAVGMAGNVVASLIQNVGTLAFGLGKDTERSGLSTLLPLLGVMIVAQGVGFLINVIAQGTVELGMLRMCLDVLEGRKADFGRIFSQLNRLPAFIVTRLALVLLAGIPMVLLMLTLFVVAAVVGGVTSMAALDDWSGSGPPMASLGVILLGLPVLAVVGIYVMMPFNLATQEVVYSNVGGVEAVKRAWALADGHRWPMLGLNFVAGAVMLAGFLACCIGVIPAGGLAMLMNLTFFLAVRRGSGLPEGEARGA